MAVTVDETWFIDCRIVRCHMTYRGGEFRFTRTAILACSWDFQGFALNTITLLAAIELDGRDWLDVATHENEGPI